MNVGIIIAIGIAVAVALVAALMVARQAGAAGAGEADYGRELEAPSPFQRRRGRYDRPGARQRAALAAVAAGLAALGAALATGLSHGHH